MNQFDFNAQQKWRYAVKKYDTSKKISDEDLKFIIEAAQLSTSSYGLQPYQLIHVKSMALRQSILPLAWQQQQIVEASDLFVIANYKTLNKKHIADFITLTAKERQAEESNLAAYQNFMTTKIFELDDQTIFNWTQKQCYLVLANMMNAAASLKIDATPMEGFLPNEVNKVLALDNLNLYATLLITLGYRHEDDKNQHLKKVRKPISEFLISK